MVWVSSPFVEILSASDFEPFWFDATWVFFESHACVDDDNSAAAAGAGQEEGDNNWLWRSLYVEEVVYGVWGGGASMSRSITQYLLPQALTQVSGADIFKVNSMIYQRYLDLVMCVHRRHRQRKRPLINQ